MRKRRERPASGARATPVGGGGQASTGWRPGWIVDGNKTEQCHSRGRRGRGPRAASRQGRTDPWAKGMIPLESPVRYVAKPVM